MLGPLLFILYTTDLFSVVSNLLVGYADDATLISVAQRPADRVEVSNSLQYCINHCSIFLYTRNKEIFLDTSTTWYIRVYNRLTFSNSRSFPGFQGLFLT